MLKLIRYSACEERFGTRRGGRQDTAYPSHAPFLTCLQRLSSTREIHPLNPQPHRYCMLASTASAPRVTRCSLGLYWSHDLCSKHAAAETGWLGDVVLSRSDSERQRYLMTQDQCPLPVYYSQVLLCPVIEHHDPLLLLLLLQHHAGTSKYQFCKIKKRFIVENLLLFIFYTI